MQASVIHLLTHSLISVVFHPFSFSLPKHPTGSSIILQIHVEMNIPANIKLLTAQDLCLFGLTQMPIFFLEINFRQALLCEGSLSCKKNLSFFHVVVPSHTIVSEHCKVNPTQWECWSLAFGNPFFFQPSKSIWMNQQRLKHPAFGKWPYGCTCSPNSRTFLAMTFLCISASTLCAKEHPTASPLQAGSDWRMSP